LIIFQRILVISSPSISTNGVFISIFAMSLSSNFINMLLKLPTQEENVPIIFRILNPFGIRNIIGTGSFSRGKFEYGRVYLYAIKHYSS